MIDCTLETRLVHPEKDYYAFVCDRGLGAVSGVWDGPDDDTNNNKVCVRNADAINDRWQNATTTTTTGR